MLYPPYFNYDELEDWSMMFLLIKGIVYSTSDHQSPLSCWRVNIDISHFIPSLVTINSICSKPSLS